MSSIRNMDRAAVGLPIERLPQGCEMCSTDLRRAFERLAGQYWHLRKRWRRWQLGALLCMVLAGFAGASGWLFAAVRLGWLR